MKHYFFPAVLIVATSFIISSCKKKEAPVPVTQNTGTIPEDTTGYYGLMETQFNYGVQGFTSSYFQSAHFSTPETGFNSTTGIQVMSVMAGTNTLIYNYNQNNSNYYSSVPSFSPQYLPSDVWTINGALQIPSFTFTNTTLMPFCANFDYISDTLSRSQAFTIHVDSVRNCEYGEMFISDGTNASLVFTLVNGNNTFNISAQQMAAFSTPSVYTNMTIQNTQTTVVLGKKFKFTKMANVSKTLWLRP